MSKTSNINVRIEPEIKEKAEAILAALGIPVSSAINMFYRQIIFNHGLPFDIKLPQPPVPNLSELTEEELADELDKGLADSEAGRVKSVDDVFDALRREFTARAEDSQA